MKFIFSLILIIFLSSAHINAADTNTLKFDNEKINEFIKKNNLNKIRPNKFEKEKKFDITKLKPFIFLAIIIFGVIFSLNKESREQENNIKPKKSKEKEQSRIDEFSYDDEENENWDTNDFESEDLKIKVEEKIHENNPYYFVLAIGNFSFKDKDFKSIEKENNQVKFTVYAFDVTDKEKEVALQGLADPYKDENYLLSSTRNMEAKPGYGYFEWTPIFLFPKSLVVPPYRGERKIKFVVSTTKINAKFEQGKIVNEKDFYF